MIVLIYQKNLIKNHFFHFYLLNIDISVTIMVLDLTLSLRVPKVLIEGSVSQIFDLGLSFILCQKTGNF